ncbi:response regulator transcription factor [Tomitella biformata]|uniref:response regulator transcription factor n=1 Tax=Tomitella biformata TaxID=630403 RepID=UPI000570F80E|nr:response regulator transcription factor [Tomitella biformata]
MVVEDEASLAVLISSYLERDGFEVAITGDGHDALDLARQFDPDIVVLDLGLPGLDGVEVCRQLRTFSDAYVVMLTARAEEIDTVIGLSVGADDYQTKPFSPRELMARIQAMMRRPRARAAVSPGADPSEGSRQREVRAIGGLSIDIDAREVAVDDAPVSLTRTEFDVLAALSKDPGFVLSRAQLIAAVWGPSWVSDEHLVDVHIGHLRRKLGDDATLGRYVRTVRGVGYRMGTGQRGTAQ